MPVSTPGKWAECGGRYRWRANFFVEFSLNLAIVDGQCHVHEVDGLGSILECPGESVVGVDHGLEFSPFLCVDGVVRVAEPDEEAIVNEASVKMDESLESWHEVDLMQGKEDDCPGWCWGDAHRSAFDLFDVEVSKFEVIVFHNNLECGDEYFNLNVVDLLLVVTEVLGNQLERDVSVNVGVHADSVEGAYLGVWWKLELVKLFFESEGVFEI